MNGREPTGKSARLAWFCRSYKLIRPRPAPFYGTWALYTTPVTPSNTTTDANDPAEPGDPTIALDEVQSAAPLVPQRSAAQPQAFASQKASNGVPRPCSNLVTQQQQSLNTIEGKTDETLRPSSTGLHEAYQTSNHVSDDDSGIGMHSEMQKRKSPKTIQVRAKPRKALKKSATAILKHSSKTARVTSKSMSVSRKSAKPRRPSSAVSSAGESPGAKNDVPLSHEADRETNGPSDNVSDRESDVSRDQVQDKDKSSASIELRKLQNARTFARNEARLARARKAMLPSRTVSALRRDDRLQHSEQMDQLQELELMSTLCVQMHKCTESIRARLLAATSNERKSATEILGEHAQGTPVQASQWSDGAQVSKEISPQQPDRNFLPLSNTDDAVESPKRDSSQPVEVGHRRFVKDKARLYVGTESDAFIGQRTGTLAYPNSFPAIANSRRRADNQLKDLGWERQEMRAVVTNTSPDHDEETNLQGAMKEADSASYGTMGSSVQAQAVQVREEPINVGYDTFHMPLADDGELPAQSNQDPTADCRMM